MFQGYQENKEKFHYFCNTSYVNTLLLIYDRRYKNLRNVYGGHVASYFQRGKKKKTFA